MKKLLCLLAVSTMVLPTFAKTPNPLCNGVEDSEFSQGDGGKSSPYLICNESQYRRLINESELFSKHFELGRDINFANNVVPPIGNYNEPFTGGFDGAHHTLSNIKLGDELPYSYLGLFARLDNARVKNLLIDHIDNLQSDNWAGNWRGAIAGLASSSHLINIHITHATLYAPDYAGGVVGEAENTHFFNVSFSGKLQMHFGSNAVGGIVGSAEKSSLQHVYSDIKMDNSSNNPWGTSQIGGLVGRLIDSSLSDATALGRIQLIRPANGPRLFGGLVGYVTSSRVVRALAAVDMNTIKAEYMGGALGLVANSRIDNVYFDKTVAGFDFDAAGFGFDTDSLQVAKFWQVRGFSDNHWLLNDGQYPTLKKGDER